MGKMINLWVPTCFSPICQTNPGVPGYRIGPVKDMKPVVWTLCVGILYLLGGQNLWKCENGGGHPFVYICQLLAIGMSVNTSITSGADSSVMHLRRTWNVGYQASDEEGLACCPNIRVTSEIGNQGASTLWLYTLLLFNVAINKITIFNGKSSCLSSTNGPCATATLNHQRVHNCRLVTYLTGSWKMRLASFAIQLFVTVCFEKSPPMPLSTAFLNLVIRVNRVDGLLSGVILPDYWGFIITHLRETYSPTGKIFMRYRKTRDFSWLKIVQAVCNDGFWISSCFHVPWGLGLGICGSADPKNDHQPVPKMGMDQNLLYTWLFHIDSIWIPYWFHIIHYSTI